MAARLRGAAAPVAVSSPLSCAALARHLPALIAQETAAEEKEEGEAVARRRAALESLILVTRARSLEDAAAQMLMAYDLARHIFDVEDCEGRAMHVLAALRSALAVVGREAGVRWQDFGVSFYTNPVERRDLTAAAG